MYTYSFFSLLYNRNFPDCSGSKEFPCMQETWVQSLGREDPLKKEMVTHSIVFAWSGRIHGQRSLSGYSPWDRKESGRTD